ncbi:hypothetical protein K474DRAFT_1712003 [Panus rudis PR-1116 ss-1]|nr:hypothetical protein K474DRAFT_1712003 [Panus rudis PR-1116 ss-1]
MGFLPDAISYDSINHSKYPHVHVLQISVLFPSARVSALKQAFPNLRTLCLYPLLTVIGKGPLYTPPTAQQTPTNQKDEETPHQIEPWANLHSIEGDPSLIAMAQINRPIRTLLCNIDYINHAAPAAAILGELNPRYLGIRTPHPPSTIFHILLAATSVTHLCLAAESVQRFDGINDFLMAILPAIQQVFVQSLDLKFNFDPAQSEDPLLKTYREFAQLIANASPTITQIQFSFELEKPFSAWKVSSDASARHLEMVDFQLASPREFSGFWTREHSGDPEMTTVSCKWQSNCWLHAILIQA